MLHWISPFGGVLIMMGNTPAQKRCSITSAWKIRFLKTIYYGSSTSTSAFESVRQNLRDSYSDSTADFQAQAFNVMNVQFRGVPNADVNSPSFGSTQFNNNGGGTFAANTTYDGIAQRHLLFGGKLIF